MVGDKHSTIEFEVGREAPVPFEIPFQSERAESHSVAGIRGLEDEKDGDGVDDVFKASAEKTWEVRPGKDPSIAQPGIEYANVLGAPGHGVTASNPQLNFVAALLGAGLGDGTRGCKQRNCGKHEGSHK